MSCQYEDLCSSKARYSGSWVYRISTHQKDPGVSPELARPDRGCRAQLATTYRTEDHDQSLITSYRGMARRRRNTWSLISGKQRTWQPRTNWSSDACLYRGMQRHTLHIHLHYFTPNGGISGVAVLAESHISVHTWPEKNYAAFDVFMCGDSNPHKAIEILSRYFQPKRSEVIEERRGRIR